WPTGDDGPPVEPAVTQLTESGRSRESVSASGSGEEEPLPRTAEEAPEAAPEKNLPEPNFQIVETLVAVPADETEQLPPRNFETNDPEVRAALQKVEVALYETKDCAVCARARDFLNHNQITFVRHAVDEDPNLKERMRRLSGSTAVPVLVIDGQVLRG